MLFLSLSLLLTFFLPFPPSLPLSLFFQNSSVQYTEPLNKERDWSDASLEPKNKTFTTIEPELENSKFGFVNLSILKNGKLRVKYLDEDTYGYVVDLPKIKKN